VLNKLQLSFYRDYVQMFQISHRTKYTTARMHRSNRWLAVLSLRKSLSTLSWHRHQNCHLAVVLSKSNRQQYFAEMTFMSINQSINWSIDRRISRQRSVRAN